MSGFWASVERVPHVLSFAEVDGVRTRILEAGDPGHAGPPLVLLHGTGGHLEAFVHNIASLARSNRVIAYDLPAHGWSSGPERSYEISGYAQHLTALLDRFGTDTATLVGQSLGGWVALQVAREHPERVDRLILVGPGGNTINPDVMARIREDSMDAVRRPDEESVRHRVRMLMDDPSDELVQTRLRIYSQPDAVEKMERVLCLQEPEVRERNLLRDEQLRAVAQPTLLVAGSADAVVPLAALERMAEQLPHVELAVLEGCGHWPQFERPEEFNERVAAFLAAGVAA